MADHAIRTRFGKDIIGEFFPPARKTKKQRVVIIASGAPSSSSKVPLIRFLSQKGFWAIHFRYRGSWESSGKFLGKSHEQDIFDVIDQFPKGLIDIWSKKRYKIKPDQIIILAGSFGGPAGMIASIDKRIDKVVSVSPLIDWKARSSERMDKFLKFLSEGYTEAFRVDKKALKKLSSGKFYTPLNYIDKIDPSKNLIIHAKDDPVCIYPATKKFTDKTGIKLISLPKGGHLGISLIEKSRFYKIFKKFVDEK